MSPTEATYRSLLGQLMKTDSGPLVKAYGAIEGLVGEVDVYVKVRGCHVWGGRACDGVSV